MSKNAQILLRLDGAALEKHTVDVCVIAPTLLSLSNLIRRVARETYGENTRTNVSINVNVEQNCFELLLIPSLSFLEQAAAALQFGGVPSMQDVLDIIIGTEEHPGLFEILIAAHGKPLSPTVEVQQNDDGTVNIADNDSQIINNITQNTYNNYLVPDVLNMSKDALWPLGFEGVERMEFGEVGKARIIRQRDVIGFLQDHNNIDDEQEPLVNITTRNLVIDYVAMSEDAHSWRFRMGEGTIRADISQTSIAQDAARRGYVRFGDCYTVSLEEKEHRTKSGKIRMTYKILEALNFTPGMAQVDLGL